jgi:hypothetical protein
MQTRDLAQADEQVGDDENDECGDHGWLPTASNFLVKHAKVAKNG